MGIYPSSSFDVMDASVENLVANYQLAMDAAAGGPAVDVAQQ